KWCEHDENSKFAKEDRQTRNRSKEQPAQRAPTGHPTRAQRVPAGGDEGEGEGAGEDENNTSDSANARPRPALESVLDRIDQHCAEHDSKKPNRTKQNLNAARLMLDKDERTLEQVNWIMDWVTAHHFWASNIMSASKLREKFDQLKGQALSNRQPA